MRYVMSLVAGLLVLGSAVSAEKQPPGALVEASVKEPPKVVEARVGYLLQFTYAFGVVPGQMPATHRPAEHAGLPGCFRFPRAAGVPAGPYPGKENRGPLRSGRTP